MTRLEHSDFILNTAKRGDWLRVTKPFSVHTHGCNGVKAYLAPGHKVRVDDEEKSRSGYIRCLTEMQD